MLVLVQVSSMKTRRSASNLRRRRFQRARRLATSGRSCSAACRLFFFETQSLVLEKVPDREGTDLYAACDELLPQRLDRQVRFLRQTAQHKDAVRRQRIGPVSPELPGLLAAFPVVALQPFDDARHAQAEAFGSRIARLAALYSRNHAVTKILGIGSRHPCWPPIPASILNLTRDPLGIPIRFQLTQSRSSGEN